MGEEKIKRFGSAIALVSAVSFFAAGPAYSQEKAWERAWSETLSAARREGQVTVYMGGWSQLLDTGFFQKAFPEIKVVGISGGRGARLEERVLTERRAGKYLADVFIGASTSIHVLYTAKALDPIRPLLLLPEVADEARWWQGRHRYLDAEGRYVFRYVAAPQLGSVFYNTQLVNPKEFHSLWDFLHPRWRGRIEARDVTRGGPGSRTLAYFYYHPDLGPKFISRLFGETQMTLFRDFRQGVDWLAAGKFAICFWCTGSVINEAKEQGLPVNAFARMKERPGLVSEYGNIAVGNKAPHPNAAAIFINWFLSRDGQLALQKAVAKEGAPDSLRSDIPKDLVAPEDRREEGVEYLDMEVADRFDTKPILKLMQDALAQTDGR